MKTSVVAPLLALHFALLLYSTVPCNAAKTKQIPRFSYMGQCLKYNLKLPVVFNTTVVLKAKNMYVMEGVITIAKAAKRLGPIMVNFTKCAEDGREETCEHFATWKFPMNTCGMLAARDMFWSPLLRFDPELACPISEGEYQVNKNNTLDMKKFSALKLPDHCMWKTTVLVQDDQSKPWACFQIEGIIMTVRA